MAPNAASIAPPKKNTATMGSMAIIMVSQLNRADQKAMLLVQRIVDPLFGRRMRFKFELETPRSRTISQERARLKKEQKEAEEAEKRKNKYVTIIDDAERKAAIESLKKTPLARTVMRRFNARIDPMSVKKKIS